MYTQGEGLISIDDFARRQFDLATTYGVIKTNKKISYYNIPAGFDIETTSFYDGDKINNVKRATMYHWQLGVGNLVTTGRTWEEFIFLLDVLRKIFDLSYYKRLIIYVHNLPYEFQFMRKWLSWDNVFLLEDRKPVYALTNGIEFRCSLKLSGGKSLANVAKDLTKYKVEKMTGYLDYNQIRTPITPLTEKELLYCENDIRVVLSYIQEKIEQDGDITRIPLTNTGYVRTYCRKQCYSRWRKYRNIMNELTLEPDEFNQLKRAFQGGFTHANARYARKTLYNVGSHDFTSSYPAVMVLEKFPMTRATLITNGIGNDELLHLLLSNNCLFDVVFFNLTPTRFNDHPLSRYKCWICEGASVDNGRIIAAYQIGTTITEQDYFIYNEFYKWDEIKIYNLRVYGKNYLPKQFVKAILKLYEDKTTLKGVDGEEVNYMIKKNMINAAYGMVVTNPVRDGFKYENDVYIPTKADVQSAINRYNSDIKRFLYYPWGVWVTAYARANLFSGIIELGNDYVYSDTDSVKSLNTEKHAKYFQRYNEAIFEKIKKSAAYHNLDLSLYSPLGKTIGVWDDEGTYEKFKTLGAKRYLTLRYESHAPFDDNDLEVKLTEPVLKVTLAGANKLKTSEYLRKSLMPFEMFDLGLQIPEDSSGRLVLTYVDDEVEGDVLDCNGVSYHYHEKSFVHMEQSKYNLTMTDDYIRWIEDMSEMGE